LRHVSEETRKRIVAGRPYRDIVDFLERVRPDEEEARVLVHARAFDGLRPGESHAALLWRIASFRKNLAKRTSHDLFTRGAEVPRPTLLPDEPRARLHAELQALGFLCDMHPMALLQQAGAPDTVAGRRIVKADALARHAGRRVRCAGFLVTGKVVTTLQGEPMEFITFEDETGLIECTFFPETYRRFCHMLDHQRPYLLEGKVEEDYGAFTLTVDSVSKLALDHARTATVPDDALGKAALG
jgi:DNA polymerase-3 subunit alpha/error-prone DNA polymerase